MSFSLTSVYVTHTEPRHGRPWQQWNESKLLLKAVQCYIQSCERLDLAVKKGEILEVIMMWGSLMYAVNTIG